MNTVLSTSSDNHDAPSPLHIEWSGQPGDAVAQPAQQSAQAALRALYDDGLPLLRLPETLDDIEEIEAIAERIQQQSSTLILIGIGGSSLGAQALAALRPATSNLNFHIMENPDPDSVDRMLSTCNPEDTSWLFVSKSGGTLETISQVMLVLDMLATRIGKDGIAQRCTVITEPNASSSLTKLAQHFNVPTYAHDPDLGGRWTCIANVGLIPAAASGVNVRDIRAGANAMLQHALHSDPSNNQPLIGACYNVQQSGAHRPIHVIMPYADQLGFTADWCRQLISESLGKDGKGITPLAALGTVDQHSMLQLMLDGPDDKFFTIITGAQAGRGVSISPELAAISGLDYLADVPIGTVLDAFQQGTIGSIKAADRPVRVIHLPRIDAYHLGALLMYFMIETIYIADMIGVNAFDQPAVEDSKIRAKRVLGA